MLIVVGEAGALGREKAQAVQKHVSGNLIAFVHKCMYAIGMLQAHKHWSLW